MSGKTNVFPVLDNKFKVGAEKGTASTIADMETFSVSVSNGVETWNPMDTEGWQRALMTSKAIRITLSGKRNIGDTGNDFVAGKLYKNGHDAEGYFDASAPQGVVYDFYQNIRAVFFGQIFSRCYKISKEFKFVILKISGYHIPAIV